MSDYAPAPWHVEYSHDRQEGNDQRPMPFIVDKKGGRIARVWVRNTGEANSSLLAAAPDHALLLRAIASGRARWEPFRDGDHHGEVCFGGLRHATVLDPFGCPVLTPLLRAELEKADR